MTINFSYFNISSELMNPISTFIGSLLGALISGGFAILVYKGNLKSLAAREEKNERESNYKEFKLLESVSSDINTVVENMVRELRNTNVDVHSIKSLCSQIREIQGSIDKINIKAFIVDEDIFQWALMLVNKLIFMDKIIREISLQNDIVFYNVKKTQELAVMLEEQSKSIRDNFYNIRKRFLKLGYRV